MDPASTGLVEENAMREVLLASLRPKGKLNSLWYDKANKFGINPHDLWRMCVSVPLIPKPHSSSDHLVDIGGSVFWLPLYLDLGYRHITMLVRPGGYGFF